MTYSIQHIKRTGPHSKAGVVLTVTVLAFLVMVGALEAQTRSASRAAADSLARVFAGEGESPVQFDSLSSLDDYLALAAERSPELRRVYYEWVAALKGSDYAGALPDPHLSYGYFLESIETRVGPQQQRFSLRQAFPWFGTLGAAKDVAVAEALVAEQRFESTRQKLFYDVKAAYYELYLLGQRLALARDNFELLKFWQEVLQTRYKVGLNQHPYLIKVQVELGVLEDQLQSLHEELQPAQAALRALLNLPPSAQIALPTQLGSDSAILDSNEVIQSVEANNASLQMQAYLVEKAKAAVNLARKSSLPQLSLGIDYIQTGEAVVPTMPESGKDPWVVNASISLPIWFGKNRARAQEAEALRRASEYRLEDSRQKLRATAERLMFQRANAQRKVRLYRDGLVPKAEQSLNATYSAYQAGNASFLDLLDAQRQLLEFQLTAAKENVNQAKAEAALEMLTQRSINQLIDHKSE